MKEPANERSHLSRVADLTALLAGACAIFLTAIYLIDLGGLRSSLRPLGRPGVADARPRLMSDWREYAIDGQRTGPADPVVTMIVWLDYECPVCRAVVPMLDSLLAENPNQLGLVVRHWPLAYHSHAYRAARAAECAADQGGFFAFHGQLLANDEWLQDPDPEMAILRLAATAELSDLPSFEVCIRSEDPVPEIERDVDAALKLDLPGTPSFLLNGLLVHSVPSVEALRDLIGSVLGEGPEGRGETVGG